MTFLIIDGERYALQLGETTLGGTADELLGGTPLAQLPPFAVIDSSGDGATIRALDPALPVRVSDAPLGGATRTLRHGDAIVAGTVVLYVGDVGKAGRTDHVSGLTDADLRRPPSLPASDPTAPTGGMLLRFSDNRPFAIPEAGLVIGRDPDCGVVLASRQVSRRHARIAPVLLGYSLIDESANGVLVNGARLEGSCLLAQGDVIEIGGERFRFRADVATYEPDADVFAAPAVPLRAPAPASRHATPVVTETRPVAERTAAPPPLLATLEVTGGTLPAGTRFRIDRPVVQIGRGAQNDVRLADESVSGAHATLLQRNGTWQLLDLGSRNGTYVEGHRVTEYTLHGVCELRLGTVSLLFRPLRSASAESVGTLAVFGVTDPTRG